MAENSHAREFPWSEYYREKITPNPQVLCHAGRDWENPGRDWENPPLPGLAFRPARALSTARQHGGLHGAAGVRHRRVSLSCHSELGYRNLT